MLCNAFRISLMAIIVSLGVPGPGESAPQENAKLKDVAIPTTDKHDWLLKHPTIQKLLKLANEERARNGLSVLSLNTKMCLAAQKHAVWMAETGVYMHSDLPWPEIIFQGPLTPRDAIDGWIHSPAHHGIMLSGNEAGFGYMVIDGRTYWVGVFQ